MKLQQLTIRYLCWLTFIIIVLQLVPGFGMDAGTPAKDINDVKYNIAANRSDKSICISNTQKQGYLFCFKTVARYQLWDVLTLILISAFDKRKCNILLADYRKHIEKVFPLNFHGSKYKEQSAI